MKEFDLGDILSITHDRLVSPRHMEGIYDILSYMTGDEIYTHAIPRVGRICKPVLLAQHPQLNTPEVQAAVDAMGEKIEKIDSRSDRKAFLEGWLTGMKIEFGDTLPVDPLRPADYEHIDPVEELRSLIGPDRVIQIKH
jgi:hypothetical protein